MTFHTFLIPFGYTAVCILLRCLLHIHIFRILFNLIGRGFVPLHIPAIIRFTFVRSVRTCRSSFSHVKSERHHIMSMVSVVYVGRGQDQIFLHFICRGCLISVFIIHVYSVYLVSAKPCLLQLAVVGLAMSVKIPASWEPLPTIITLVPQHMIVSVKFQGLRIAKWFSASPTHIFAPIGVIVWLVL